MKILVLWAVLASGPLADSTEEQVDAYLAKASLEHRVFGERLRRVAKDALGTEYADGPLGEGAEGKYDADPLVDFSRVDCVTYVEQVVASATASGYDEMMGNLLKIRYEGGEQDYEHRNHFMISDWVRNNAWVEDVSGGLGVETEGLARRISRREFFELVKAPGVGADTPDESVAINVVPSGRVRDAEAALPDEALVVFVGKVDWLFSLHCGLYLRDEAGVGRLYHASSKAGEVVAVDLGDYVEGQGDRYVGITAYRVTEPAFGAAATQD